MDECRSLNTVMIDIGGDLASDINTVLMKIITVLYEHDYETVNIGGLLRVLGMDGAAAEAYDGEIIEISRELAVYARESINNNSAGHTIH